MKRGAGAFRGRRSGSGGPVVMEGPSGGGDYKIF
jgi:hypothetical protein